MNCQRLWLVSLFLLAIAAQTSLYSYPVRFTRLVQEENGKILKVVDLIGDYHIRLDQLTKKPSKWHMEFLTEEERKAFIKSERGLLVALGKISQKLAKKQAQDEEKIALLWESEQNPALVRIPDPKATFILYGAYELSLRLRDIHSNIRFIPSDTYRAKIDNNVRTLFYDRKAIDDLLAYPKGYMPPAYAWTLVGSHWDSIKEINRLIEKDIATLQSKISKNSFEQFQLLWGDYQKDFSDFYTMFFETAIKNNEKWQSFFKHLNANNSIGSFLINSSKTINWIMDFELLINIFSLKQHHVVIYAGEAHTTHVAQLLIQHFGFKEMVDIGFKSGGVFFSEPIKFSLSADAWQFLEEDPFISLKRYEKNKQKPYSAVVDSDFFKALKNSLNYAFTKEQIDQAFKAHIDVVGIQIDGQSLLNLAIEKERWPIVELLLKNGAEPDKMTLVLAVQQKGSAWLIKELLQKGTMPYYQDNEGNTALHYAVKNGDLEIIKILPLSVFRVDYIKNKEDETPLDMAKKQNRRDIVEFLERGKDFSSRLHKAMEKSDIPPIERLIKEGTELHLDVAAMTYAGVSFLKIAIFKQMWPVVELLLRQEQKADLNTLSNTLAFAIQQNSPLWVVEMLLEKGANPNYPNYEGETALHNAVIKGADIKIIRMLLSYGARQIKNKEGKTPFDIAQEKGKQDIVDLLKKKIKD